MGNSLRCCLACVLPCGALDLIRIVHLNGYVEEITRVVTAGEILDAYPNHVLSKPCSQGNNMVRKIMILSPDSELKRGSIYFLIPDSSLPSKKPKKNKINAPKSIHHDQLIVHDDKLISKSNSITTQDNHDINDTKVLTLDLSKLEDNQENCNINNNVLVCEAKLLNSKSKSGKNQRRRSSRGKSGIWQPHLEIITEDF